jgi:hypothetical protein
MSALQQFADKLGMVMEMAIEEISSLEVSTYMSDSMSEVRYENNQFSGAQLRALTRISFAGNTALCVSQEAAKIDEAFWKIHLEMVERAQANRAEMLKTAVSAAAGLLGVLKGL